MCFDLLSSVGRPDDIPVPEPEIPDNAEIKIVICGAGMTGKTSLVTCWNDGGFDEFPKPSFLDYTKKTKYHAEDPDKQL